ncbi:MAG: EXLDI protein [Micrococcales bacterium]|nr:MAG: EXLDI protein [Micrococcales bacterium]
MPSKMIYVSTEDLPLYERAQVLSGGNLSATVTEALRSYIEMKEEHEAGYEAITVPVGKGARRRQRFYGVLLGEWRDPVGRDRMVKLQVYRTRKGRYVIYARRAPDWSDPKMWVDPSWGDSGRFFGGLRSFLGVDWSEHALQTESTLEVVDSKEELKIRIPEKFYEALRLGDQQPPGIEELDI